MDVYNLDEFCIGCLKTLLVFNVLIIRRMPNLQILPQIFTNFHLTLAAVHTATKVKRSKYLVHHDSDDAISVLLQ